MDKTNRYKMPKQKKSWKGIIELKAEFPVTKREVELVVSNALMRFFPEGRIDIK